MLRPAHTVQSLSNLVLLRNIPPVCKSEQVNAPLLQTPFNENKWSARTIPTNPSVLALFLFLPTTVSLLRWATTLDHHCVIITAFANCASGGASLWICLRLFRLQLLHKLGLNASSLLFPPLLLCLGLSL